MSPGRAQICLLQYMTAFIKALLLKYVLLCDDLQQYMYPHDLDDS